MKQAFKKIMAVVLAIVMIAGILPSAFAAQVGPFTDVKDTDWYAPYVKYVYEHDPQLMNGVTPTTFDPNGTCTRAMAAVVLYRLADPVIPAIKPSTFVDLTDDWYKNGVAWAQQKGVVNGVDKDHFNPTGLVTREQLVTMMWRYDGSKKTEGNHLAKFPDAKDISDYAKEAFNWAISKGIIAGSDGKLLPRDNATRAQFAKIISVFADTVAPCVEHKWDDGKVTKEPDCTEAGEKLFTCTRCGATKTEKVPALGHIDENKDNKCDRCGVELGGDDPNPPTPPTPTGDEYVLTNELKSGDKVVFYNPGNQKALTSTMSGYYVAAADVAPADGKLTTEDKTIVWTVEKNTDGTYTFTQEGGIVLGADTSTGDDGKEHTNLYTSGEHKDKWTLTACATANLFDISNAELTGTYGPVFVEYFKSSFSAYSTSRDSDKYTEAAMGFELYVLGGEPVDPNPPTPPTPAGNEYVLTNELKGGEKVVIYNAGNGEAVPATIKAGYYLDVVAVTPEGSKITTEDSTIVWDVVKNADGTFTFKNGENVLSLNWNSSISKTSVSLDGANPNMTLESCNAENSSYVIYSATQKGNYEHIYLERFAYNGNGEFSAYDTSASRVNEKDFGFQFYVLGGEPVDPPTPPTPTGDEYVLTNELKSGDKVVFYNPGNQKALTSTMSGYYVAAADVAPADGKLTTEDKTIVWTVEKNTDGTYSFTQEGGIVLGADTSTGTDGKEHTNLYTSGEHKNKWTLTACATANLFDITNAELTGTYGPVFVEYFKGTFSAYSTSRDSDKYTEAAMGFELYVLGGEPVDPPTPPTPPTPAEGELVKTELKDIQPTDQVVIAMHAPHTNKDYALLSTGAKGPAREFDGKTYEETMLWNFLPVEGGYTIQAADGSGVLYATDTNNGVNFGDATTGNVWTLATPSTETVDYLSVVTGSTTRYLGVYDNNGGQDVATPNFRVYAVKAKDGVDKLANISGQTLSFYVVKEEEAGAKITMPALTEIDKYGDVRLSITSGDFKALGYNYADLVTIKFLNQELVVPVIPQYRYVAAKGTALVMWEDASRPVELEIFNGSFAETYGIATKTTNEDKTFFWTAKDGVTFPVEVTVEMKEVNGYYDEYVIFDLQRTNAREDYPTLTDEEFANFRNITTTGMGKNALYRSSSPVNPAIGRNTYADQAAEKAGIKTIMNLADDQASAEAYAGYAGTYYSKQNVIFLGLGVDFATEANRAGLASGLRYFTTHEGPYLFHCNEGQDRAGFTAAVLEAYMGATYDEIVADYMKTFMNYYGVELGTRQYTAISNNIVKNLKTAFAVEDLTTADLKAEASAYLTEIGLTDAEKAALTANLSKDYTATEPTPPAGARYVKVTEAPADWSGKYLIVFEQDDANAIVHNGKDATGEYLTASISNGVITASSELDAVAFTIAKMDGGYSLMNGAGQYLSGTSGSNKTNFSSDPKLNTIAMDADGVLITSNTSVLRWNSTASSGMRFRYYKAASYANQKPIQLYVLVEG